MIAFLNRHQSTIVIAIFLSLAIHVLLYTYIAATPFIRADGWRYMDIYLIPLWNGTFEWKMLWNDIHPYPLSALLYILNVKYFGLNMMYEAIFGIIFKIAFVGLLFYLFKKSMVNKNLFYFLPILFIILSFNSTVEYTWSLVSLVNVDFFLMFLTAAFANNLLHRDKNDALLIYFIFAYLSAMICDYDTNLIFSVALVLALSYIAIVSKKLRSKALFLLSILVFILFIFKIFLIFVIDYKASNLIANFSILFNLKFIVISFVQSVGASVFDFESVHKNFVNQNLLTYFSYPLALFWLGSIVIYLKKEMYKITLVPFMMVIFHLLLIGAIILYRPTEITAPRYTSMYQIGMIGGIWIYALYFMERTRFRFIFLSVLVVVSVVQLLYIPKGWNYFRSLNKITHQHIENLYNVEKQQSAQADNLNKGLIGNYFSLSKLEMLKERKLNIYSEDMYKKFHSEQHE